MKSNIFFTLFGVGLLIGLTYAQYAGGQLSNNGYNQYGNAGASANGLAGANGNAATTEEENPDSRIFGLLGGLGGRRGGLLSNLLGAFGGNREPAGFGGGYPGFGGGFGGGYPGGFGGGYGGYPVGYGGFYG